MAVCIIKTLKRMFLVIVLLVGIVILSSSIYSQKRQEAYYKSQKFYIINTLGCQIPYYGVSELYEREYHGKSCDKDLLRSTDSGSQLLLNLNDEELMEMYSIRPEQLEILNCSYFEIKRVDDYNNTYGKRREFILKKDVPVQIPPDMEFIGVVCKNRRFRVNFKGFYFFALNKTSVQAATSSQDDVERISVMLFGIDTFSHMHFLRIFSKTKDYINKNLPHVEYWGYNKVGDNSFANLMPLLGNYKVSEVRKGCMSDKRFDNCTFIWDEYKKFNYTTVYAEDYWFSSVFVYELKGFKRQPTDYVLNPIVKEMHTHIGKQTVGIFNLCYGGRKSFNVLPELLRKLTPYALTQDFFSFYFTVAYSHEKPLVPKLIENDVINMLDHLLNSGVLNRTFLFLFSDHGFRWGRTTMNFEGKLERNQPLLIAIYPKWFAEKYTSAIFNLAMNARRLTTPFDVHESLKDLANLTRITNKEIARRAAELIDITMLPRGISLFLPIPVYRTCDHASIAPHWCTCYQRQMLPNDDPRAQQVAGYVVDEINKKLRSFPQCAELSFHRVDQCEIAVPNKRFVNNDYDHGLEVTVRLVTKPGEAVLEATVHILQEDAKEKLMLTGTITRANQYKNQSYCIDQPELKLYCYCKTFLL